MSRSSSTRSTVTGTLRPPSRLNCSPGGAGAIRRGQTVVGSCLRHPAEVPVDGQVAGELGVEGRDEDRALAREDRVVPVAGQHLDPGADAPDPRCADEDHAERLVVAAERRPCLRLEGLPLPAVAVALHGHVDQPEGGLTRAFDLPGEHDQAGARAEQRSAARVERAEGRLEVPGVHQVEERRALAPGKDQALHVVERSGLPHLHRLHGRATKRRRVEREIALEREDADAHRLTTLGSGGALPRRAWRSRAPPSRRRAPRSPSRARPDPGSGSSPARWRAPGARDRST